MRILLSKENLSKRERTFVSDKSLLLKVSQFHTVGSDFQNFSFRQTTLCTYVVASRHLVTHVNRACAVRSNEDLYVIRYIGYVGVGNTLPDRDTMFKNNWQRAVCRISSFIGLN